MRDGRRKRLTVAVAGATGFVGRSLIPKLAGNWRVIALSRRPLPDIESPPVEWRRCDLFSLFECEHALAGVDAAFYLVHSMLPSARLTQGSFPDMDLIIADNFARAAARVGVRQIIYLGGLIPDDPELSRHIQSRREVGQTLGAHGVPVTALRAGIIIGRESSSYAMLRSVVERVPLIVCPRWAGNLIQPVAIDDIIRLLIYCLRHPSRRHRRFDVGAPDVLSYRQLLERSAAILGRRRIFLSIGADAVGFTKLLLTLISGYPRQLVSPLVESLRHNMVARERELQRRSGIGAVSFATALRALLAEEKKRPRPPRRRFRFRHLVPFWGIRCSSVRSVQRIALPEGKSARWAALLYMTWLPLFFKTLLRADADQQGNLTIGLRHFRLPLLELHFVQERSAKSDRQLFYISGGLLAKKVSTATRRPRLEFREALSGRAMLVAIHDYQPALPWPLYNLIQARAHLWVMKNFAREIRARSG